ncbi:hypothetical protein BD410DRAFT_786910 [Rickenella mellea]|uniref:Uncharacterized protein n=1 Tax=Rickenella mellea TaxID=50990 RepID=A0A4Y7Q7N8_9AGAM|nr:hypothetical protein BD410DRAFT_786910 [Rickenella mellea]
MPKNHRFHSRPKQLPQTAAMSPPHTYTSLGAALGSNTTLTLPQDDQDEDDICPVCESECTCDNRPRHISINTANNTPSHTYHAAGSLPAANPNKESPQSITTPSLKIKLTLPPSFQARASANRAGSKLDSDYNQKTKKSKRPADAISASGSAVEQPKQIGSPFSPLGQPLRSGAINNGSQLNADGTLPKKRGRPPKAVAIAKEAAKATGVEPLSGGIHQSNVGSSRQPAHASKAALPKKANSKVKAVKKTKAPVVRKVVPQKTTASVEDASSSELTDPDDDNEDVQSIQFPTFMTAVSISSNESSASSSDADSDSDIEAEEERYILAEDAHAREKARLRKELMGESDQAPHRKWGVRNNWEIRSRRKSVGAEGGSDVGMDTDSGEETEEEEEEEGEEEEADAEDEDEVDPGVASETRYVGVATGWSDEDEESSFDADLFFANLNDSSGSDDDIEHADGEGDSDSELSALSITEAAAAGFLAPFEELGRQGVENLPFDVTEGWDGQFTFTNGLKEGQGILDFDFEISAAQLIVDGMPTVPGLEDADIIMATSEEEEAMETMENDEDIDYTYDDSDGDTTEDEFVEMDGVPTPRHAIQLRFPATLGSIDPLSTLSPVVSPGPTSRTLSAFSELSMSVKESPKPADILAGKVFNRERSASPCATRAAGNDSARSPPNASAKLPKMGDFTSAKTDQVKKVIVNESSGIIPCPFPVIRRLRRSGSCASKRSGSGSDIGTFGSGRSRPSSLLGSTRSPYQSMSADDFMVPSSPDFPPTEPIELHDVLESSFLEAEPLDVQTTESDPNADGTELELHRHLQNLSRWERIPLDTFRRTRMAGGTGGLEAINTAPHGSYRTPKPADGFSYGSSVGGMMRGSPLSATLWQSQSPPRNKKANGRANYSVLLSPVILPVRDGEQTPTNNQGQNIHHHLFGHSPNSKSRKEMRKEKKRNRKMMNAANAHHHRQHYPNAKKRSTGSMQRSNFSSSPMPTLSI